MRASIPEKINSMCVFCGSRMGALPLYKQVAYETGAGIAKSGVRLVFGAGGGGLMGTVAQGALDNGGKVTGVIPEFLKRREVPVPAIDDLIVVDSMHTRKGLMYEKSDVFVVLPGGLGTLDELVEVVTWFQLGLHRKPVFLVDVEGFWQPWLTVVQGMATAGFIEKDVLDYFETVPSVDALFKTLGLSA